MPSKYYYFEKDTERPLKPMLTLKNTLKVNICIIKLLVLFWRSENLNTEFSNRYVYVLRFTSIDVFSSYNTHAYSQKQILKI